MSNAADMEALAAIEELRKNATVNVAASRKKADDLLEKAVTRIQAEQRCRRSEAYAKASADPIAKEIYTLSIELQEREQMVCKVLDW